MATRYGDANENEYNQESYMNVKRRATRHYDPTIAHHSVSFKPFTKESLANIRCRRSSKAKKYSAACVDPSKPKPEPDPYLASGQQLPPALARQMPAELIGKPIEDIDPYYDNQETFVIISRSKELTRFSAKEALYIFGPFHPIRRIVLYILVNPIFNLLVILTILINCILMTIQGSDAVEETEIIFTIIYTTEMILRVLARGFIIDDFTYLRDPWNWLDFAVINMAYLTIVVEDLGNLSVMRTFRVLRALKTVAIIPGMKTIVGAVIDSVKNLKDVVVLTLFSLSVFSLLGLQIYMGILTQKCILNGPSNMTDMQWFEWNNNSLHWIPEPNDEIWNAYRLCGNATGAQPCPSTHTCLQGFGPNPDYGFTNFDTFGWALICSFRLMTQDFWEGLYMQVLKTAGSWHIIFFIVSIFLGSIYLMNLILAIVAMSYNELQRRAEEEEEAAAQDEAAFLDSCRLMELQDQISQYHSSPDPGTSYRPSVEIGLVGQTLLTSLCQNGLLGQQVRDKLNQQLVLPTGLDPASVTARSHSLSVNLDRRVSHLGNNQWMAGPTAHHHHNPQYDPLTMATSMTELRRKSSVRTNDSDSPKGRDGAARCDSGEGKYLGQRRILPEIGVGGSKRSSMTNRRSSRLFLHRHVSSSYLMSKRKDSDRNASDASIGQHTFVHRFPARPSATSDRDLQMLRQRAAMIRIGSENTISSNEQIATNTSLETPKQQSVDEYEASRFSQARTLRKSHDLGVKGLISYEPKHASIDLPFSHTDRMPREYSSNEPSSFFIPEQASNDNPLMSDTNITMKKRIKNYPQQESVICEQPTSSHPFGRTILESQRQQYHDPFTSRLSICQARRQSSSVRSRIARRLSTLSNVERPSATSMMEDSNNSGVIASSQQQLARKMDNTLIGLDDQQHNSDTAVTMTPSTNLNEQQKMFVDQKSISGSMKNLRPIKSSSTASSATSRFGGSSNLKSPRQLGPEICSRQDNMHHLSVENFQQFNSTRHSTSNQLQVTNINDQHRRQSSQIEVPLSSRQNSMIPDNNGNGSVDVYPRFRPRYHSNVQNIHPSTMVRSSFSRPRQSFMLDQNAGGNDSSETYNTTGVRRVSKDFVRRASDWSRLSMSANVDLRRLLKLWSYTNPYQGGNRPSIGSYSNNSQADAKASPNQSIRGGYNNQFGGNTCYSSRMSSVGSAWQAYELFSAMSRRNQHPISDARGPYATIPLDDNLIDNMSINMRDKCIAYCLSCLDILCIWECCGAWLKIQKLMALVVFDPFTELFIILCILINTLFMALDSDDADDQMRNIFERGNYFFTATFAVEASMKIMALSPKFYFREGWNVFDSIIVGLSLLELGLEGVYGLSVLRSFRLLRVFKLAKSWPTLNLLISIMGKAVGDLGNLTFVLAIIVFIFAVMGMQLFGTKYVASNFPSQELPRWNFTDFMHSFMIVFRILCAEWIEPMWDCLLVGGWPCIPFFLIAVTVGNLVVLNLFLALLLASFGASNLSSPQADNVDTKKLQEAIARFTRFGRHTRRCLTRLVSYSTSCILRKNKHSATNELGISSGNADTRNSSGGQMKSHIAAMSRLERLKNIEQRTEELKNKIRRSPEHHYYLRQLAKSQLKSASVQQPATGFNYNYESRAHTSCTGPMPTIPIIVNEACEPSDELEPSEIDQFDSENAQKTRRDDIVDMKSRQDGNQEFTADSISLNSDVSLHASDFKSLGNDNNNCYTPTRICSSTPAATPSLNCMGKLTMPIVVNNYGSNRTVGGYLNNMQPIREDSKDDSNSSLSQHMMDVGFSDGSNIKDDQCISSEPPSPMTELGNSYGKLMSRTGTECSENNQNANQKWPLEQLSAKGQDLDNDISKEPRKQLADSSVQFKDRLMLKSKSDTFEVAIKNNEDTQLNKSSSYYRDDRDNQSVVEQLEEDATEPESRPKSSLYLKAPKRQDMEEDDEKTLKHIETYIERCICIGIICLKWFLFRQYIRKIVEHKYFDQCILILIVISSGTLALEDKHLNERPTLKQTLDVLDTIFTIVFSLEMVFKWLAFGMRRYFGNIWSWLDFIIVLVSFVNLMASIFGSGKIQALKTMRTLRAMRGLRPLRALQRFQGMRVVVNALIQAIPSIFNVLLVCLIFWLIFSIMGVQMFGGKFWRCLDPETDKIVSYEVAENRLECLERNLTWANPQINFDNVLNAYLALFQVATFKGWIDIMDSATDSRMRDDQPIREANIYMYFYFVFFVIFGSFFTLNLFIGVIIDNFNEQKKKTGGSLEIFMTDDQKKYYHAMKKMRSKKPIKAMTRPKFKLQAYMFDIVTSKRFDLAIMLIIGLNMFVMALEHYGQSQEFSIALENLNLIFIAIFTLECLCKIFAMRHFYFREPWNIFDFIVVALSLLGVVMKEYVAKYFVSPTLLRVVRVVKVGRVLRLVKGAKGIRTLLFALAMSLPALFNICLLLFLVMFIYAIFGMSFFMNVRKRAGIDETFNFETFTSSIIVLFQMSTSAGWEVVLDPLMDEENDCQKPDPSLGIEGTCGNKGIAIAYLISYVIVTFLIIINMYIAVILENYSQATEDVQEGLTDDDYEMYYEIWQKFDPNGTQYLPYSKLSDFVDALEDPLRIPKPNDLALVVLDINIYQGDQCYCVDILDALTKYFFTRKGFVIQVNEHLQKVQSTLHETPFQRVTTTYLLKREHYCAKVIQNCWRRWRERTWNTQQQQQAKRGNNDNEIRQLGAKADISAEESESLIDNAA